MKTRPWNILALCLCLSVVTSAADAASLSFAPRAGADAIVAGRGGMKITNRGIDIWLMGEPAGNYRILGELVHSRWGILPGDTLTTSSVAKAIRRAGGDAAYVVDGKRWNRWGFYATDARLLSRKRETRIIVVQRLAPRAEGGT